MTARGPQDTLFYYWWPQEGHKTPCANIDDRKIIPCPAARPRHLQYGSAPPPGILFNFFAFYLDFLKFSWISLDFLEFLLDWIFFDFS